MAGGWASIGLLPELVQTVEEDFGWTLPTAIQDEAIPLILGAADVMASAETGSGKTAAFALPILQLCAETKEANRSSKDPGGGNAQQAQILKYVMSMQDRDPSIAIDPTSDGLRIQSRDPGKWAGCRGTTGVLLDRPSKYSFECKVLDEGLVRVGWSTADASLQLGTDGDGYGYGGTGVKVHKNKYDPFPNDRLAFSKGDTIGCHLEVLELDEDQDKDSSKGKKDAASAVVSFSKNGTWVGEAFRIARSMLKQENALYPAVCLKNAECQFNFGGKQSLSFQLPAGHIQLSEPSKDEHTDQGKAINPRDSLSLQCSCSEKTRGKERGLLAIVVEPTRDLAEQTFRAFDDLASRIEQPEVRSALLVGGINPKNTLDRLQRNQVDILVGTPPILASNVKKGTIKTNCCRFFVLDEADELIGNDSLKNIRAIYGRLLAASHDQSNFDRLQVCFFSATLHSKEVQDLAETICHRPLWIDVRGQNQSILPDTVHHFAVELSPSVYDSALETVTSDAVHRQGKLSAPIELDKLDQKELESEKIKQLKFHAVTKVIDKFAMDQVLIFCRTNLDCDLLEKHLRSVQGGGSMVDKYSCRVLAGMRKMEERQKNLRDFKEAETRILICTDVASRGIDISELPYVINMTLPDKAETYVHRVGRVGRAERLGLAISLVSTVEERVWWCRQGKKPPCPDTRDFDKGGNCIWYDEPDMLGEIQKLLERNKVKMTKLSYPDLTLPPDIQSIVENGGYGDYAGSSFVDPELEKKMRQQEDRVRQITLTESALQADYWHLRNKFGVQLG